MHVAGIHNVRPSGAPAAPWFTVVYDSILTIFLQAKEVECQPWTTHDEVVARLVNLIEDCGGVTSAAAEIETVCEGPPADGCAVLHKLLLAVQRLGQWSVNAPTPSTRSRQEANRYVDTCASVAGERSLPQTSQDDEEGPAPKRVRAKKRRRIVDDSCDDDDDSCQSDRECHRARVSRTSWGEHR